MTGTMKLTHPVSFDQTAIFPIAIQRPRGDQFSTGIDPATSRYTSPPIDAPRFAELITHHPPARRHRWIAVRPLASESDGKPKAASKLLTLNVPLEILR